MLTNSTDIGYNTPSISSSVVAPHRFGQRPPRHASPDPSAPPRRTRRRAANPDPLPSLLEVQLTHIQGQLRWTGQFPPHTTLQAVLDRCLQEATPQRPRYHMTGHGYRHELELDENGLKPPLSWTLERLLRTGVRNPLAFHVWVLPPVPSR